MFKSGFIGIVGKPNVGKSTLLNRLVGERIAIATHKPQTTRNRIMGIRNMPGGQFIFLDTPGLHRPQTPLNRYMVDAALEAFGSSDILVLVVEAPSGCREGDIIIDNLEKVKLPVILAINKIDLVERKNLLPLIDCWQSLHPFAAVIPLCARTGKGIDLLLQEIEKLLPEGPELFPADMMTDRSERFIAAEMIREQSMLLVHQEIPYSLAVMVDSFQEQERNNLIRIQATIYVEKQSQKGILIGKGGTMLKQIGTAARQSMEKFFGTRIYLELFVKVHKDWTRDKKMLRELGYWSGEKKRR